VDWARALNSLPEEPESPAAKLRAALAMFEEGVAMQRLNLARRHPAASPHELEALLARWLGREDEA
jgi:hypothetical protein